MEEVTIKLNRDDADLLLSILACAASDGEKYLSTEHAESALTSWLADRAHRKIAVYKAVEEAIGVTGL